jgi:hypothetical protein
VYLKEWRRAGDQWVLTVAMTAREYDTLELGTVIHAPNGREGLVTKKVGQVQPAVAGSNLDREVWAAFPHLPKDYLSVYWERGMDFSTDRPPGVADVLEHKVTQLPKTITDGVGTLWDTIPTWAKVTGGVIASLAALRIIEEVVP